MTSGLFGTLLSALLLGSSSAAAQACSVPRLLPAYSHNDYRSRQPLQDALALGYGGAEADYVAVEEELLVAHGRGEVLQGRTLERLYLAPLRTRVRRCGWVESPDRPFLLTIEYKERSLRGHRALRDLLSEYADVLGTTSRPGPVQVVLVGWHPPLRDVAVDSLPVKVQARITRSGLSVPKGDTALIGLVSLDYGKNLRWRGRGELSERDRRTLAYITAARRTLPGRLVRAYNVPPTAEVYRLLLTSGVDLIGTKELGETAAILSRCCN